jgi:hypothetical protein
VAQVLRALRSGMPSAGVEAVGLHQEAACACKMLCAPWELCDPATSPISLIWGHGVNADRDHRWARDIARGDATLSPSGRFWFRFRFRSGWSVGEGRSTLFPRPHREERRRSRIV